MNPTEFSILVDILSKIIIILAAFYGVYEYFLFRKSKSITEDSIDLDVFTIEDDKILLNLRIRIHNKSRRRKYLDFLLVGINFLAKGDLENSMRSKKMIHFSDKFITKRENKKLNNNILEQYPRDKENIKFWIDAGTVQIFNYPIAIQAKSEFIQINCEYSTGRTGNKYFSKIIRLESFNKIEK